jgi:hypothetical protein
MLQERCTLKRTSMWDKFINYRRRARSVVASEIPQHLDAFVCWQVVRDETNVKDCRLVCYVGRLRFEEVVN